MPERKRPSPAQRFSSPRFVGEASSRCAERVTSPPPPHLFLTPALLRLSQCDCYSFVYFRLLVQLFYLIGHHVTDSEEECEAALQRAKRPPPRQRPRCEPRWLVQTKDALFTGILSWPDRPPPLRMSSGHFFSPSRRQNSACNIKLCLHAGLMKREQFRVPAPPWDVQIRNSHSSCHFPVIE